MKLKHPLILAGVLTLTASLAVGQAKFSGIYSGKISTGYKLLVAITKGGNAIGLDDDAEGLYDTLNPKKSSINAKGKFKGSVPNGTSVVGKISAAGKLTGTAKSGKRTARLNCKRILK